MLKINHLLTIIILLFGASILGQTGNFSYSKKELTISKKRVVDPKTISDDFMPRFENLEAPQPGGKSYRSFLLEQKQKSSQRFPRKKSHANGLKSNTEPPIVKESFGIYRVVYESPDTAIALFGGTPLDNTMAISNDNILMISVNSQIYAHDLNTDSVLFHPNPFNSAISFGGFASQDGVTTSFPFDPKLVYDPHADRFIIVFLSGREPSDSKIVIGFSTTNNPTDPWNIYEVPGDPRMSGSNWSDYPAFALSENELFLTINMIIPDVSWQVGFDGTVIWQIPLADGYQGLDDLNLIWWDDIKYEDKYIRNLNPIKGAVGPQAENMFFVSNRNFDELNDSIFLLEVTGNIANPSSDLNIKVGKLNTPYGMPPNGKQQDHNSANSESGLQTNDARWLGGFILNDNIQFVGNSIDTATGNAAVYHGFIENASSDAPVFTGNIIGDPVLDYGYPNIAYTGKDENCDNEAIIAFDHSSTSDYAGISSVFYSNLGEYSEVIKIKEGHNYVDNFLNNDPYERWGDYFGIQRKFNEPGKVWTSGFYGYYNRKSAIWVNELQSPDSLTLSLDADTVLHSFNACHADITLSPTNGISPYTVFWNGNEITNYVQPINLCGGEYQLEIIDAQNCKLTAQGGFSEDVSSTQIFPNPVSDRLEVDFQLTEEKNVLASVYDTSGQLVKQFEQQNTRVGKNRFSFSTTALQVGVYVLKIEANGEEVYTGKLVKWQ